MSAETNEKKYQFWVALDGKRPMYCGSGTPRTEDEIRAACKDIGYQFCYAANPESVEEEMILHGITKP